MLIPNPNVYSESIFSDVDTSVLFVSEFVSLSLDLVEDSIIQNSLDDAKTISKITTEIFPLHLQNLRASNSEISDEIHILLLDLHNGIGILDNKVLLNDIQTIQNLI